MQYLDEWRLSADFLAGLRCLGGTHGVHMGVPGRKPTVAQPSDPQPYVPAGDIVAGDELAEAKAAPGHLTPRAIEVWHICVADLVDLGVFKPSDRLFLAEFCRAYALQKQYGDDLDVLAERRDLASPEAKVIRTGYAEMHRITMSLASEFGFSPVARMRLGLMKVQGGTLLGKLGASPG